MSSPTDNSLKGTHLGIGETAGARMHHTYQFNMTVYNMKIDFGGLDQWDYQERVRNVNEAELG